MDPLLRQMDLVLKMLPNTLLVLLEEERIWKMKSEKIKMGAFGGCPE